MVSFARRYVNDQGSAEEACQRTRPALPVRQAIARGPLRAGVDHIGVDAAAWYHPSRLRSAAPPCAHQVGAAAGRGRAGGARGRAMTDQPTPALAELDAAIAAVGLPVRGEAPEQAWSLTVVESAPPEAVTERGGRALQHAGPAGEPPPPVT